LRKGDKQRALLALRRKKYQESLLEKTDQQLAQLQALTSDVEFALVQKDVIFGLQQGTAVLKAIHKEIGGLEKVEMILEESAEAQAYQRVTRTRIRCHTWIEYLVLTNLFSQEISEMLAGQMSNEDEDAVEDELEALEREAGILPKMPDAPTITNGEMPDAPQTLPTESKEEQMKRRRREREERSRVGAIEA
jgi:charged multivesicular body protein 6